MNGIVCTVVNIEEIILITAQGNIDIIYLLLDEDNNLISRLSSLPRESLNRIAEICHADASSHLSQVSSYLVSVTETLSNDHRFGLERSNSVSSHSSGV